MKTTIDYETTADQPLAGVADAAFSAVDLLNYGATSLADLNVAASRLEEIITQARAGIAEQVTELPDGRVILNSELATVERLAKENNASAEALIEVSQIGSGRIHSLDLSFWGVRGTKHLRDLPELTGLAIVGADLSDEICSHPSLKQVTVFNPDDGIGLVRLTQIPWLEELTLIDSTPSWQIPKTIFNFAAMPALPSLKKLEISNLNIKDCTGLPAMPELRCLVLNACGNTLAGVERYPRLEKLIVSGGQATDLAPLESLTSLKTLYVCWNQTVKDLSPISNLPIIDLNLSHTDLRTLAHLPKHVRRLALEQVPISSLQGIERLTELEDLSFAADGLTLSVAEALLPHGHEPSNPGSLACVENLLLLPKLASLKCRTPMKINPFTIPDSVLERLQQEKGVSITFS